MRFIELLDGHINIDHIIAICPIQTPQENGDFVIKIALASNWFLEEPEPSFNAMMERYREIIEEVNS